MILAKISFKIQVRFNKFLNINKMSRVCQKCKKKPIVMGIRKKLRGHYNPTGKRTRKPNLQWFKDPETGKRYKLCTKCIHAYFKQAKAE